MKYQIHFEDYKGKIELSDSLLQTLKYVNIKVSWGYDFRKIFLEKLYDSF